MCRKKYKQEVLDDQRVDSILFFSIAAQEIENLWTSSAYKIYLGAK